MTSFISRSFILTFAFLCSGLAAAEVVVPLTIGGTEIRFAADDGYLRTSETLPTVHAVVAAGLPPGNRLVEGFVSEADAKRLLLGLPWQDTFMQVQALRNAEAFDFSEAEWEQGRPAIAEALGVIDFNALIAGQTDGSDARMSAAAGVALSATFGELGKPVLYASQGRSLRFLILLPMTVEVAGQSHQVTLESAGAVARLADKLVYLFAYRIMSKATTPRRCATRWTGSSIAPSLSTRWLRRTAPHRRLSRARPRDRTGATGRRNESGQGASAKAVLYRRMFRRDSPRTKTAGPPALRSFQATTGVMGYGDNQIVGTFGGTLYGSDCRSAGNHGGRSVCRSRHRHAGGRGQCLHQ